MTQHGVLNKSNMTDNIIVICQNILEHMEHICISRMGFSTFLYPVTLHLLLYSHPTV